MLFALCDPVPAQLATKVPRIGFLITSSASVIAPRKKAFRQGLHELGYVEGKNLVIERRHADGKLDRLPGLVAELVRLNVDVIVTSGPTATRPAQKATSTIPIVMTFDDDPVGSGFVASLARPGGNVTGLSTLAPEISGKQMELLKEIIPKLDRAAVIGTSTTRHRPEFERDGTRRSSVRGEASISGHTKFQRDRNRIPSRQESTRWRAPGAAESRFIPFSILREHRSQTWRLKTGWRLPIPGPNLSKTAG
jgi:hypothetical protein